MANRQRIHYLETDIRRDLYTNGLVLMLFDTWENYIGFYHYYESTGEIFTEPDWHPTKSRKLVPYKGNKSSSYFKYVDLVNYKVINGEKKSLIGPVKLDRFKSPVNAVITPTEKQRIDGVMNRYFVMKRNEKMSRLPIEIDEIQAEKYSLGNRGINQYLYELVEIPWKLSGPEYDKLENGMIKTHGVYDTNKRIVEKYSKKFPILMKVLTNYRQFSIYDV